MLPAEVQALVDDHPHLVAREGKVICELNGHAFPAKLEVLQAFLNGKKYAKLKAAADLDKELQRYEPFIVKSKNLEGTLFCALTGELLNARLAEVKHHLKGKKFQRAKERFQADEQELLEEPRMGQGGADDMEEDGPDGSDGLGVWMPQEVLQEYEAEPEEVDGEDGAAAAAAGGGEAAAACGGEAAAGEQQEEAAAGKAAKSMGGAQQQHKQQKGGRQQGQQQQKKAAAKPPRAKKARTG